MIDQRHTPEVPLEVRQVAGQQDRKRKRAHDTRRHGLKRGNGEEWTRVQPHGTRKGVRESGDPITKHFLK